eukprot:1790838-Pleurochrysis_carterae.AAC.1
MATWEQREGRRRGGAQHARRKRGQGQWWRAGMVREESGRRRVQTMEGLEEARGAVWEKEWRETKHRSPCAISCAIQHHNVVPIKNNQLNSGDGKHCLRLRGLGSDCRSAIYPDTAQHLIGNDKWMERWRTSVVQRKRMNAMTWTYRRGIGLGWSKNVSHRTGNERSRTVNAHAEAVGCNWIQVCWLGGLLSIKNGRRKGKGKNQRNGEEGTDKTGI